MKTTDLNASGNGAMMVLVCVFCHIPLSLGVGFASCCFYFSFSADERES